MDVSQLLMCTRLISVFPNESFTLELLVGAGMLDKLSFPVCCSSCSWEIAGREKAAAAGAVT